MKSNNPSRELFVMRTKSPQEDSMSFLRRNLFCILLIVCAIPLIFAHNPPPGGDSTNAFFSPELLGGNSSVTGGPFAPALPGELTVNPALSAAEQRITLDASYAAIMSAGDQSGFGHLVNAGALYPTRRGVLGASAHLIKSPFASLPLDTALFMHSSFSKELTDRLHAGIGLLAGVGDGWGLSGEVGILYLAGNLGFLQDSKIGFSVTGLGRTFTPDTWGLDGPNPTGYASAFTPHLGIAGTLVKTKDIKFGLSVDVSAPTVQNFVLDTGLEAVIRDKVTLRTGWNFNMKETAEKAQTYIPSFGIGVNLKLNSPDPDSFLSRQGWSQSEMTPSIGAKPLYEDLYAIGAGFNIRLGVKDTNPPEIAVDYPEPVYFSPNSDGVQDELLVPVTVSDERDIVAWSFVVQDDTGDTVRTIENKEARPEMQDLRSFWTVLTSARQGVALPDQIRWDGSTDSGETAPDGSYTFRITATDDNGNTGLIEAHTVTIDNTPPQITARPPTGANAMIFSPDGDGNKDTFTVALSGSKEDLWKAEFMDAAGTVVRTITTTGEPQDTTWNGQTDSGSIVPDGVYAYRISAVDRAGNTNAEKVDNIIVDTVKPAINISIDHNAFSPNGDSIQDTVRFEPAMPVTTGLVDWTISVKTPDGTAVRTFSGTGAPASIAFDGKDDSGKVLPENRYQAVFAARYSNGHAPEARSAVFELDITPPEAQVRAKEKLFAPVGDGKLETVTFTQQASREESWTGEIIPLTASGQPGGSPVRTFALGPTPESTLVWDGRSNDGKVVPDGQYGYHLTATDRAGNTGTSSVAKVAVNTEKADVILQVNTTSFSPNGDDSKDTLVFTPVLKAATATDRYRLTIARENGSVVKSVTGTGQVPATITWNGIMDPADGSDTGTRAPDGTYRALLEVTLINQQTSRSASPDFVLDTVFPSIEISAPYTLFSPNSDKNRDILPITQRSSKEELWTGTITTGRNTVVRTFTWRGEAEDFEWNATDNTGNRVSDGTYTYSVSSTDRAGNTTTRRLTDIVVDSRTPKAYITAGASAFSPNGDGIRDTQQLSIVASIPEGLASWRINIIPDGNKDAEAAKTWDSTASETLPATIRWDGRDDTGEILRGSYYAELVLNYHKGDRVQARSSSFLVTNEAPELNVRLSPRYFSPDNDGIDDEQYIQLAATSVVPFEEWTFEIREPQGTAGNIFWKTGGKDRITEQIIWDGRSLKGELVQSATDYPFTFTVKDSVGMVSVVRGYIPVDVLVIRDDGQLKIAVPSIIFRENAADFEGLDPEIVEKNVQVLKRIAEIINKFRDYRIQVEGHANNVTGTQREEDAELIPLSRQRAQAVRDFLIRNGVDGSRLSTVGMGGTKPVVERADRENWWKNRRVEFILIK